MKTGVLSAANWTALVSMAALVVGLVAAVNGVSMEAAWLKGLLACLSLLLLVSLVVQMLWWTRFSVRQGDKVSMTLCLLLHFAYSSYLSIRMAFRPQ